DGRPRRRNQGNAQVVLEGDGVVGREGDGGDERAVVQGISEGLRLTRLAPQVGDGGKGRGGGQGQALGREDGGLVGRHAAVHRIVDDGFGGGNRQAHVDMVIEYGIAGRGRDDGPGAEPEIPRDD